MSRTQSSVLSTNATAAAARLPTSGGLAATSEERSRSITPTASPAPTATTSTACACSAAPTTGTQQRKCTAGHSWNPPATELVPGQVRRKKEHLGDGQVLDFMAGP